ncbi:predicted protein [Nematostella vectensis]|uniref:Folate receptor-like domain-containing protein n=1 Tax=Nematostella vectensis TaxID=45351 RepID=A7REX3_NEMVE|nr:predicted protein [Nematostella vectensis]|eukprot:XP_001641930.1 predicted protein [Nematostella vectensis]
MADKTLVLKASYAVDTCIEGPLHKSKPGPEGPDYAECFPWKENSCCTADFTIQLAKDRVESLYNLTYNHCGNLSQRCEAFVKNEECFWQCEPNLIKWHKSSGIIDRAPICGSYCDAWFLACQDDMTCVQDWLNGFNYTSSTYTCPVKNKCRTFKEIFKSGEVLCNTMWGSSFKYEASNKNCMVMNFTGPNPNTKVSPTISSANTIAQLSLLLPVIIVFKMLIL